MTPDEELYQLRRAEQRVSRWLADKWQLEALLGVGGMAAVYAARHRNGNRVAIKILHPEVAADERMRLRFLQEGYVANKVEHPGVVTVLDDGVDADGTAYIVMELLEGKSVEDLRLAAGGRLRPAEVLRITKRLLEVLRASHRKGIVHRDLKPENIFVTANGDVKVLDFGIARIREVGAPSSGTRTGVPMGTPSYMPPEQARGHWDLVDERSDLWAVGATMYASLTGKLVHDAETLAEMIASALRPVAPIQARAPYVPAAVAAIVDRALAFKKDARWRSAGAMQRAIVRAEAEGDLEPAAVPRAPTSAVSAYSATVRSDEFDEPAKTPGRRRRLALVAMLAGALLLGAMWIAWGKGLVFSAGTNAAPPESSAPEEVTPSTATAASAAPAPTEAAPPAETAIVDAGAPIQRRPRQPARPPPPSVPASSAPKPRSKIGPLSEDL